MRKLIMEYASAIVALLGSVGIFGVVQTVFLGEKGFFHLLFLALGQGGY